MALEVMEEYSLNLCVRGYHIYQDVWEAVIGETLQCVREPENTHDRYAVAVKKDGVVVGHLPKKISRVCSLFLRRGGVIECSVTGRRKYSDDLPQGGMEIPCMIIFKAASLEMKKLKKIINR